MYIHYSSRRRVPLRTRNSKSRVAAIRKGMQRTRKVKSAGETDDTKKRKRRKMLKRNTIRTRITRKNQEGETKRHNE
jgi:hypothetical protein